MAKLSDAALGFAITNATNLVYAHVRTRVRPMRTAFLVDPRDRDALDRIIRINTSLWGGALNAIVPVFSRAPHGWPRASPRRFRPSATDAARGYVDAFQPDYVVDADGGLANRIGISPDITVTLSDLFDVGRRPRTKFALSIKHVYRDAYEKRQRFVQRDPESYVMPEPMQHEQLLSAWFGAFPDDGSDVKSLYTEVFRPEKRSMTFADALELWRVGARTPLGITVDKLKRFVRNQLTILLVDEESGIDLLDFWNLRALGWRVIPVPGTVAEDHVPALQRLIDEHYHVDSQFPDNRYGTTLLKSFGCDATLWQSLSRLLRSPGDGGLSVQDWMPRIWDGWARSHDFAERLEAYATEEDEEIPVRGNRIVVQTKSPPFDVFSQQAFEPRWINECQLRIDSSDNFATDLPRDVKVNTLVESFRRPPITVNDDGLVLRCGWEKERHYLRLPLGRDVFASWAESKGFSFNESSAGLVARHIVRQLDGISGAAAIASVEVLKQLNRLAHSLFKIAETDRQERRSGVRAGTIGYKKLVDVLIEDESRRDRYKRGKTQHRALAMRRLDMLTARDVLRVGVKLKCPECSQFSWFGLSNLTDNLTCDRCLSVFRFPSASPNDARWEYRPVGPFAIENYALGSYVPVLTFRFFRILNIEGSWTTAFEIERSGQTFELDFGLFAREKMFGSDLKLILGECKAGEARFKTKDFRSASAITKALPGAAFVFATTRDSLDADEIRRMRVLAARGRRLLTGETWRNPFIVLTRRELEADFAPPQCWEDLPTYSEPIGAGHGFSFRGGRLQWLADSTQQLHLGMISSERELSQRMQAQMGKHVQKEVN